MERFSAVSRDHAKRRSLLRYCWGATVGSGGHVRFIKTDALGLDFDLSLRAATTSQKATCDRFFV